MTDGVLAGQVAVVTGASRGIGEALACRFVMEGAKVVVSARTLEPDSNALPGSVSETVERIRQAGGGALAVKADLSSVEDRHDLIRTAEDAYSGVDWRGGGPACRAGCGSLCSIAELARSVVVT